MKKQYFIACTALVGSLLVACGSGEDGEDGEDGANGDPGTDGNDGVDGNPGADGAVGADGEDGEDGKDGEPGEAGEDGEPGQAGEDGEDGAMGTPGADGSDLTFPQRLIRLATTPLGAELTGMEKTDNGDFFFNIQHPSTSLPGDEGLAAVGAWIGVDVDNLDPFMEALSVPDPTSADAQTTRVAVGSYQALGREGDTFSGDLPAGFGNIIAVDGTTAIKQSNDPDFNAFIPSNADGSEGFLFSAWEDRPGGVTRLALSKEDDGSWSTTDAMNIDFSSVNGTIINCFGTVSPWGTPLTSEENYEAENTARWNDASYSGGYPNYDDVLAIRDYLGLTAPALPNPYDYGYIVEITDPKGASPGVVKHYTLGRVAHENPVVMPDWKTVYLTDDGGFKGFYKFVATTRGDLSAGTLYAAKVTQDATKDSAKAGFDITWIELGTSENSEIEALIRSYDGIEASDYSEGNTNFVTDEEIAAYDPSGPNDALAFIETLRVAKALGATVEFNKMEGININYDGVAGGSVPFMYVAMADVTGSMSDGTGDIDVNANRCGIVYRFGLTPSYDVLRMEPAVVGGAYDSTAATDRCDTDGIAQPDNIAILDDGRVLIGEDTSNHLNNVLWIFNPKGS